TKMALVRRCAALRPGDMTAPLTATKYALRAMARRWLTLSEEIREHEKHLDHLTISIAPLLRDGCGIGPDAAAEMLTVVGDNFTRITSEPPLRSCAASTQSPRPRARRTAIASTEGAIDKPTRRSTASSSSEGDSM